MSSKCDQLHRHLVEYDARGNCDYIEERLWLEIRPKAYSYSLGFLDRFSKPYEWEPDTAHECISWLFSTADWRPFNHQLIGRKASLHSWRDGSEQYEAKDMK